MKLKVKCKSCKTIFKFSSKEINRTDLAQINGEVIKMICPKCNKECHTHVNSIIATRDGTLESIIFLLLFGSSLVIGIFVWKEIMKLTSFYMVSSILGLIAVPTAVFLIYMRSQTKRIKGFNRGKVRGLKKR